MSNIRVLALVVLVLLSADWSIISAAQQLVLTHVTVIDMTGAAPRENMTVIIEGQKIISIASSKETSPSTDALVVDASGKYLIPGLWDMHLHTVYDSAKDTETTLFPLLIANGITGTRNPGSSFSIAQINRWRQLMADGALTGPRIFIGQQVDGPGGPKASFVYRVKTESEARATVQRIKREGFDFVKVYSRLSRDAFFAAADEARRIGIPFAGHVPTSVNNGEASDAGQKSIEHLEGMLVSTASDEDRIRKGWLDYEAKLLDLKARPVPTELEDENFKLVTAALDTFNEEKARRLYAVFVRNGTYQCPTLVIHQAWGSLRNPAFFEDARLRYVPLKHRTSVNFYLDPARSWSAERKAVTERLFQFRLRMVREMQGAGVELLAGTDTAYGYPVPGFALHDELGLFVQAGLTPMEALRTATYNPAKYFGLLNSLGTVEPGKIADLVLLKANPLDNIGNTKKIEAVVVNGRYFPRDHLDKLLVDVEAAAKR
jgi:imidazolonepropionase-like amidohydrolase